MVVAEALAELEVKLLHPDAQIPARSREGDAGHDLQARRLHPDPAGADCADGGRDRIAAGIAGARVPRSGLAARHGITTLNAPGLVDPNYRGEIKVILHNAGAERHAVAGDRIAQLLLRALRAPALEPSTSSRPRRARRAASAPRAAERHGPRPSPLTAKRAKRSATPAGSRARDAHARRACPRARGRPRCRAARPAGRPRRRAPAARRRAACARTRRAMRSPSASRPSPVERATRARRRDGGSAARARRSSSSASALLSTSTRGWSPAPISSSTSSTARVIARSSLLVGARRRRRAASRSARRVSSSVAREGVDELVGQLADEADGVGHQVRAAVEPQRAGRRVERVEEAVADADLRAGERVEQRRLAGVRVAGERDRAAGARARARRA